MRRGRSRVPRILTASRFPALRTMHHTDFHHPYDLFESTKRTDGQGAGGFASLRTRHGS